MNDKFLLEPHPRLDSSVANHIEPNFFQSASTAGPPPLMTFEYPCDIKYSFAFCPRPPPPQCVMIGVDLFPPVFASRTCKSRSAFAERSKAQFTAFGRALVPQSAIGALP